MPSNRSAPIVVGLVCLVAYVLTLSQWCWVGDSGELTANASILGISHPPGYPIYTLLGNMLLTVIPLKPAVVLNLLSAMAGAASAAAVAVLLGCLGGGRSTAIAGGLLFGFARTTWLHCTVAEVYSCHILLSLLTFLCAVRFRREGSLRYAVVGCWIVGLGTAHHTSIVLLLPALVIMGAGALTRRRRWPHAAAICCGAALLAFTAYLYLPIRSRLDPANDWGDPETLRALWEHVTGRLYLSQMGTTGGRSVAVNLAALGRFLAHQWSPLLLLLPVGGAVLAAVERRREFLLLAAAAVPVLAFGLTYSIPDIEPQFLPLSVIAVLASSPLLCRVESSRWGRRLLPAVAIVPLVYNFTASGRRPCSFPEDYATAVLAGAPTDATIICQGQLTPVLAYVHQAEGFRPDLVLVDRLGNLFEDPYGYRAATSRPSRHRAMVEQELLRERGELFFVQEPDPGLEPAPCGLLFLVAAEPAAASACDQAHTPSLSDPPLACLGEPIVAELATQYHLNLAAWADSRGETAQARRHVEACRILAAGTPRALTAVGDYYRRQGQSAEAASLYREALRQNRLLLPAALGLARVRPAEAGFFLDRDLLRGRSSPDMLLDAAQAWLDGGRPEKAEAQAMRALRLDPRNCDAELVLGNSFLERGRLADAESAYRRSLATCPQLADAWANLCMVHGSRNEMSKALEAGLEAVEIQPRNTAALNNLAVTYARLERMEDAAELWRRSLAIDPDQERIRTYLESAARD